MCWPKEEQTQKPSALRTGYMLGDKGSQASVYLYTCALWTVRAGARARRKGPMGSVLEGEGHPPH